MPQRLKFHEKPENNVDFIRYPYGNSPVKEVGYWKIHHGYDFGPEQLDYEDHSYHMLHQRPTHWRSFWVVFMATTSLCVFYYTWLEMPFFGTMWGQSYMNVAMNGIKYLNHDEKYHDWDKLLAQFKKSIADEEAGEEEEEPAEEAAEDVAEETDLVEVVAEEEAAEEEAE